MGLTFEEVMREELNGHYPSSVTKLSWGKFYEPELFGSMPSEFLDVQASMSFPFRFAAKLSEVKRDP